MSSRAIPGLYRLITDHDDTSDDEWLGDYHEWYLTNKTETRDTLGRRNNGYTTWHVLECNNWECFGKAIVNMSHLIENQVPIIKWGD
jgi:hypothetical protein